MSLDEVLEIARAGAAAGCREALFTLGDKPELRYRVAREELAELGFATTLEYLREAARVVLEETGLLPHLNPGVMTRADLAALRPVSASMGIMLETTAERLSERGGPHRGAPDKDPALRLETIRLAGELSVPFTSGILIGIGETRAERLDALHALAELGGAPRPPPGGDRPELQGQARHADGEPSRTRPGGSPLDDRRRAPRAARERARAGAAQPRLRRLPAPARRRHRRLGRGVAGDGRPRESRGALARARQARRRNPGARTDARPAAAAVPGARPRARTLGRPGGGAGGPPRRGLHGPRARGSLGAGRDGQGAGGAQLGRNCLTRAPARA